MRVVMCLGLALLAVAANAEVTLTFASPLGAHRGGRGEFPESTVYAYEQCAAKWPDILLEGDLHLSADGVPVVMHDMTVDRTTDGSGKVGDKTLAELKQLDAAYKFSTDKGATFPLRGQGITVPTLKEVLLAAPKHQWLFELKAGVEIVDATLAVLKEVGAMERVIIASFNPVFMGQLRERAPELRTCFDTQTAMKMVLALRGPAWESYVPTDDLLTYSPGLAKTMALKPEELAAIKKKGIALQAHTLNTEEEMKEHLALGVDSILTDYPSVLDRVLQERGKE